MARIPEQHHAGTGNMPSTYPKTLIAPDRNQKRNRDLGALLPFVAGAINAGRLVALGRFSSHVTGAPAHIGAHISEGDMQAPSACLMLLCLAMGLRNAMITKLRTPKCARPT